MRVEFGSSCACRKEKTLFGGRFLEPSEVEIVQMGWVCTTGSDTTIAVSYMS